MVVEPIGPEGPGFVVQAEGTEEQGETNQEQVVLASEEASEEEPVDLEQFNVITLREVE